jgi:hypothetical protein
MMILATLLAAAALALALWTHLAHRRWVRRVWEPDSRRQDMAHGRLCKVFRSLDLRTPRRAPETVAFPLERPASSWREDDYDTTVFGQPDGYEPILLDPSPDS